MSIRPTDAKFEHRVMVHLPALTERKTSEVCQNGLSMGLSGVWTDTEWPPGQYAVNAYNEEDGVGVVFMFTLKDLEAVEAECEQCKGLQHNPHYNEEEVT